VKGEVQGTGEQLKEFIQHINKGPKHANVTGIEHSDIETKQGESGFNVH
jgi:acylphosphatase